MNPNLRQTIFRFGERSRSSSGEFIGNPPIYLPSLCSIKARIQAIFMRGACISTFADYISRIIHGWMSHFQADYQTDEQEVRDYVPAKKTNRSWTRILGLDRHCGPGLRNVRALTHV
jgi:hypothetical protein